MSDLPPIVPETPADFAAVESLIDAAFGPGRYTKTAERLREGNHHLEGVSVVAREGGAVVGCARMWPVKIGETIRVEAQVDERKPLDDEHELVTLRWRVLASDKLAVRAKIQAVRRVAAGASAPANGADGEPAAAGAPNGPVQAAGAPVIDSSAELYGSQVLL